MNKKKTPFVPNHLCTRSICLVYVLKPETLIQITLDKRNNICTATSNTSIKYNKKDFLCFYVFALLKKMLCFPRNNKRTK